jgi:hypothetical protein
MANIGDSNYENDGRNERGNHDGPDSPHKLTAGICNTEQSDSNTALDCNRAGGIEKFGYKEKL